MYPGGRACAEGILRAHGTRGVTGSQLERDVNLEPQDVNANLPGCTPSPARLAWVRAALRWGACGRAPTALGRLPTWRVSDGAMQRGQTSSAAPDLPIAFTTSYKPFPLPR